MSYSYEIGTQFSGTGTATINATTTVEGAGGTAFLTEFAAGYLVQIAGEWRVVQSVTDNDTLVVTAAFDGSSSGNAIVGANLKNLGSLATPVYAPRSVPALGGDFQELGDAHVRAFGAIVIQWQWGFVKRTMREQLRTFCTGMSADVYIRSREMDNSDGYQYYSAVMRWPADPEDRQAGRRLNFTITFANCVELTVS